MKSAKILIIEDDVILAKSLKRLLQNSGLGSFLVDMSLDGNGGLQLIQKWQPDLVLLDLHLPILHGHKLLTYIQHNFPTIRVLVMTGDPDESEEIKAYGNGCDDFIQKPFSSEKLISKINALLRRDKLIADDKLIFNDIYLSPTAYTLTRSGAKISLTDKEYEILKILMRKCGEVVNREIIIHQVWDSTECYPNILDVYIKRIRQKIDDDYDHKCVKTAFRKGYYFDPPKDTLASI